MKRYNHFKRHHAALFTVSILLCVALFYVATLTPFASLYTASETTERTMSHIRYGVEKDIYTVHKGTPLHTHVKAEESYVRKGEDGVKESLIGLSGTIEELTADGAVITRTISAPVGFLNYSDKTLFSERLTFALKEKGTPLFSGIAKHAGISLHDGTTFTATSVEGDGTYAP